MDFFSDVYNTDAQDNVAHAGVIPTVFVALGGTGKDVLMRLRKRFFDRDVESAPGYTRFLFVDTDPGAFRPESLSQEEFAEVLPRPEELVPCSITPTEFDNTFERIINGVHHENYYWLKPEMRTLGSKAVQNGAGTHREFGRLGFFLHVDQVRNALEQAIQGVLNYVGEHPGEVEPHCVEVVIVTSLAGGTGSGMFLDVSYLVKTLLKAREIPQQYVTLVAFLPTAFRDEKKTLYHRMKQNAYAALLEMEYYGTPKTGDELFLGDGHGASASHVKAQFHAPYNPPADRFIEGPAWGDCYLIDDTNDLDRDRPLSRPKLFQMVADYLFLDFEHHEFATRKRSARSNLEQIKHRWCANWVRGAQPAGGGLDQPGEYVYVTHNGCGYSSFGLAEIFFDVDRLYKAAGYRLAERLVLTRWLGPTRPARVEWAEVDLIDPRPQPGQPSGPPSFARDALVRRLLTSPEKCWLDVLEADLETLRSVDPAQGLDEVTRVFKDHQANLGEKGEARTTIQVNARALSGTPQALGPLRERLRTLTLRRMSDHGVSAMTQLLELYRERLHEEAELLIRHSQARDAAFEAAARLEEAGRVGGLVRRRALQVEFPRARERVGEAATEGYDQAAAVAARPILAEMDAYLGAPDHVAPPELAQHGTLHALCKAAGKYLAQVDSQLDARFKNFARPDDRNAPRRQSLSTGWSEQTFDRKINEALIHHPRVGPGDRSEGDFSFDWKKFEDLVVERLAEAEKDSNLKRAADLFLLWNRKKANPEQVSAVVEQLAALCRTVLRGEGEQGGLRLEDVKDGNAVDFLASKDEVERKNLIDQMVRSSAPFLPISGHQTIAKLDLAHSNLYGSSGAASPENEENIKALVRQQLNAIEQNTPGVVAANAGIQSLAAVDSALVLAREVVGFPIQYYSRLGDLRDAYQDDAGNWTRNNNECHIDYHFSGRDLPDICALRPEAYRRIRENVYVVLRAILIGEVNWEEGEFRVRIPNVFGGARSYGLGTKFDRAIKSACDMDEIRTHLDQCWNRWKDRADTRDWACLFAAIRRTLDIIGGRVIRLDQVKQASPPLLNCYHHLYLEVRDKLAARADGQRWAEALAPADPKAAPTGLGRAESSLLDRIAEQALGRVREDLPIFQVLAHHVGKIELPAAPDPDLVAS